MLNCIDSGWKMCSFFLLFCLFIYCFSKKIVMQTYEFMHRKQSERSIRAYTHFVPVIWWDRDRIREPPLFFVHVIINLLCVWSYQMRSWNIHFTSESNALKETWIETLFIFLLFFRRNFRSKLLMCIGYHYCSMNVALACDYAICIGSLWK